MYRNTDNRSTEEIVEANPFWVYVRTDRNGTRYFNDYRCDRCGGKGLVPYRVDNGICYKCGGDGRLLKPSVTKVYTESYAAVLEEKRLKKEQERIQKLWDERPEWLQKYGFGNEEGEWVIYRVVGNTYSIKEELKELGAKFNFCVGWYFSENKEEYECQRLTEGEVLDTQFPKIVWKEESEVKALWIEKNRPIESASNYVGAPGDRIQIEVSINFIFRSQYYDTSTYILEDCAGNIYKWSTQRDLERDKTYKIKVTVKDHVEYKGIKQTVVTRGTII